MNIKFAWAVWREIQICHVCREGSLLPQECSCKYFSGSYRVMVGVLGGGGYIIMDDMYAECERSLIMIYLWVDLEIIQWWASSTTEVN